MRTAIPTTDLVTGYQASLAVLGALIQRGVTGRGQFIDAAMLDASIGFNVHLAQVMESVRASVRAREHGRHNLYEINWKPVPADKPATLDHLMEDYVAHLKHHLRQILGSTWPTRQSGK